MKSISKKACLEIASFQNHRKVMESFRHGHNKETVSKAFADRPFHNKVYYRAASQGPTKYRDQSGKNATQCSIFFQPFCWKPNTWPSSGYFSSHSNQQRKKNDRYLRINLPRFFPVEIWNAKICAGTGSSLHEEVQKLGLRNSAINLCFLDIFIHKIRNSKYTHIKFQCIGKTAFNEI